MDINSLKYINLKEPDEGVAVVSFARPERRNAVHKEMLEEMLMVVDAIAAGYPNRYRAVVLRGEGDGFSAGGDLQAFHDVLGKPRNVIETYIAHVHQFALAWYDLPMPTIAAMHGVTPGGGAAMGMLCDLRYAAVNTVLHFSFLEIGLIADMGSHYMLPSLIGSGKALELLFSGEPVEAEEAYRLGLLTRVLPTREETDAAAITKAAQIARAPHEAMQTTKKLIRQAHRSSMSETVALEVSNQTDRFLSPVFAARIEGFFKKK